MKRLFAVLLTVAMIVGIIQVPLFAAVTEEKTDIYQFSDMPNDWSTAALKNAVKNGLLVGNDGKILPNEPLTRAQMAAVIVRAFGATVKGDIRGFTDVNPASWYADDVAKAYQMGVVFGHAGKFNPNDSITRQEAFAIIARAIKIEPSNAIKKTFKDADKIADWFKGEIYALVNAGYVQGHDGILDPLGTITRAQFAQVFDNIIKQYFNVKGEYSAVAEGNIMINTPDVTLRDVNIKGDLIIGDGVGDGDVTLNNVSIAGRMVVRGGGANSIRIMGDSVVGKIIIDRGSDGTVRIYTEDGTDVGEVIADGNDDIIIEGKIESLVIKADDVTITATNAEIGTTTVSGQNFTLEVDKNSTIGKIEVNSENSTITTSTGSKIGDVIVNADGAAIEGTGQVKNVAANANNVDVNTPGTSVKAAEGTTGVTAGSKPVNPGGSETVPTESAVKPSPGGGSRTVSVSAISVEGGAKVGETLTAKVTPDKATVNYQWQRADAENGTYEDISGATGKTYTLTDADQDMWIRVKAIGEGSYSGTVYSDSVGPVPVIKMIMSAEDIEVVVSSEFTMPVTVKSTGATIDSDDKVRFYGVIPGLTADDIDLAEITGGKPTTNIDEIERNYAGANEGDLVLAWGPEGGFSVGSLNYTEGVTTHFKATIKKLGVYTVTFVFYDLTTGEQLNAAGESATITVREPAKSEYGFEITGVDQDFVAGDLLEGTVIEGEDGVDTEGLTPVEVTLKATTINELGYDNVKVLAPEVTGEGTLQFWAYSADDGKWFDAAVTGWGSGFPIMADYDVTTPIYVFADTAGTYEVTFKLVDLNNERAVIAEKTETITVLTPAEKAVKDLGLDMVVTPINNGFKAKFNKDSITVPDALNGYKIDVFISLESALPEGTKVTILWNGNETEAKDKTVGGTEIRLSDLVLSGGPANFTAGAVAEWTVLIGGENIEETLKGTIRSIISNDGFEEERLLLAEGSFDFIVDTKAPTAEWNVAKVGDTYYTVTLKADEDLSKFTHHTYMSGSPLNIEMDDDSWTFKRNDTIMDLQYISDIENINFNEFVDGKYYDKSEDEQLAIKAILTDGFEAYYLKEGELKSVIFVKYDVNDKTTFTLAFEPTEKTVKDGTAVDVLLAAVQGSKYSLVDTFGNIKTVNQ